MYMPDATVNGVDSEFLTWEAVSPPIPDSHSPTSASRNDESMFGAIPMSGSSKQSRTLAPNLTRRSHKKSRAGCFTCKNRKIKCGEQKPKCNNCTGKGLECVYPSVDQAKRKEPSFPLAKRNPAGVTGSPATSSFTMLDMRFFHHFLTTAYPHLPLGNDHVWVNEIPQFAENHEYLMHAILSLGASHLSRLTGIDYRKESLTHRGQAIAGLNLALSQPARTYGESDATLAACYALTFQASYMGDGLADFITMVRGCALTTVKIKQEDAPTAFNLQPNTHLKLMAPRLANLPRVNPILCESGLTALDEIRPMLTNEVDLDFHQALIEVLEALLASPQTGYLQFTGIYAVWYELSHSSFKSFLDPANLTAQLLLSYFIALQMIMVPLAVYEWPDRADSAKSRVLSGTVEWAHGIFRRIQSADDSSSSSPSQAMELQACLAWPKKVIEIVSEELRGAWVPASVGVLQLGLPITPQSDDSSDGGLGRWRFWENEEEEDLAGGGPLDPIVVSEADDWTVGMRDPLLMETVDIDIDML